MTDSTDAQLIRILGQNGRLNSEILAKQPHISSATVRRRLRKLIRSNSLRIVGAVDPSQFGLPLAAVINLDVSNDRLESAMEMLVNHPEIRWVSSATGRYDIIAFGRFPSTDSLSEFLTKQLSQIEGLSNSETFVCLDVRKGRFVSLI